MELSAQNRRALYVPAMFAHGYQTLTDDAQVAYQVDEFYAPQHERGLRYDDPRLALRWPVEVAVISPKDASWPLLEPPAGAFPVGSCALSRPAPARFDAWPSVRRGVSFVLSRVKEHLCRYRCEGKPVRRQG